MALKNDGPEFYDIARKSRERTVMQSPCENPRLIFWRRPVDTKEMRYCFVMRTAVTTLTLLATLFHFTVGCCGGMHADSGHVDSHADAVAICEHGCDHGGDHAAEAAAEPGMADHLMPSLHDGDGGCPGHDCHGCSCSATHDERPLDSHAVDFLTVAWVGPAIAMIQSAVSVAWEAADPPVRATIAPPLSERLLV